MASNSFRETYIDEIIDTLAKEGERIVKECLEEKEYKDRTYNLRASYGWGVYYKGKFVKVGYPSEVTPTRPRMWYGEEITGPEEVQNFFERGAFKPPSSKYSLGLVIAAAMPYGENLETGNNYAHRTYKVVSMSFDKLQLLSDKYGGASVATILRNKISETT